jgi:very-short-patch-repair endonuclease
MKRHAETRVRAKELRANLSPPERTLWNALRASRLGLKFQRQVVLAPYIADFAARSERLVIELDGETHVGREAYDAARTVALEARGYRVLRFANNEVVNNLDGVLRTILIALGKDPELPGSVRDASRGQNPKGF